LAGRTQMYYLQCLCRLCTRLPVIPLLLKCHREIPINKAAGVDQGTKTEYEANLTENMNDLLERLKKWSYRPQSFRSAYIPKEGGNTMRPQGMVYSPLPPIIGEV